MRRLSKSIFAEFNWWGCNPGFIVTSEGIILIDTPQQPIDARRWWELITESYGAVKFLINTEHHWDHIHGNAFFPEAEVIAQQGIADSFWPTINGRLDTVERMKETDPDSYWLASHPAFPPKPPTRTFTDELAIPLGDHTLLLENCPGHTKGQTHVYLPEEGVLFIGDNIFHQCMTWLQECDPWHWVKALERLQKFDGIIVPGHGEPCTKAYVSEQREIIEGWLEAVAGYVERGLTEDEAVHAGPPCVDPYPLAQRLHEWKPIVHERSIRNLYQRIVARDTAMSSQRYQLR